MATIYSSWQTGLRIRIDYTQTKNVLGNYSTVAANYYLEVASGYAWYNSEYHDAWWQIDSASGTWDYLKFDFRSYTILHFASKSYTVQHGSDGTGSIYFYADYYTGLGDYGCSSHITYSGTTTLESIDRNAPTTTQNDITDIQTKSFVISAYSNYPCKTWQYTLDDGTTWVDITSGSAESSSVSKTVTGLSFATTYSVKIRATRTYNEITGTSATKSAMTTGGMTFNSATDFVANEESQIKFNGNFYGSYRVKFSLKDGSTTLLSEFCTRDFTAADNLSVTLDALTTAQKNTIYSDMASVKTKSYTLHSDSYSVSGSTETFVSSHSIAISFSISSAASPTLTLGGYLDSNSTTVAVTGDSSKIVAGYSTLRLSPLSATYKNGATFGSLKFTVDTTEKTMSTWATYYDFGTVSASTVVAILTDSRGYTSTATLGISLIAYQKPQISYTKLARKNSAEAETHLDMTGTYSKLTVDGTDKNAIQTATITVGNATYNLKTDTTYWSDGNGVFEYDNGDVGDYDPDSKFECTITITDKISSVSVSLILMMGTAVMSIRDGRIRICRKLELYDNTTTNGTVVDMTISGTEWEALEDWYDAN